MTSLSDYDLFWCSVQMPLPGGSGSFSMPADQYVFTSVGSSPASLSRAQSVQDLLELITQKDKDAVAKVFVGVLALLAGNLIALQQWYVLTSFVLAGLTFAIFPIFRHQLLAYAMMAVLCALLSKTLYEGRASFEWLVIVALVVLVAVISVMVIRMTSRLDPRSHVLLKESPSESVVIRNQCAMDVKILSFDPGDMMLLIPLGGLIPSSAVLPRGDSLCIGDRPPYTVKVFANFETEMGTWANLDGTYILRATAPAVNISRSGLPTFTNCTETPVVVCLCQKGHWTGSLWLPMAQIIARLVWQGQVVAPGKHLMLHGPYLLRVYTGLVGLAHGMPGGVVEKACCAVGAGEAVEYVGGISWNRPLTRARDSVLSVLASTRSA
eukprot:gb/GFBE01001733.1/.p1 GENE.gb/GFBE01001733.1/~~gb/GFBE01001733.1/.p1  ORF type:complete len:381 (+),score=30.42 gb/GFBE01001733.1/:1-1143(+)